MKTLITILSVLLRVLLPALTRELSPTCEDGQRQPELRRRLQQRVRATWGAVSLLLLLFVAGCASRTIYVPNGEPVRLRETIKGAKVWVLDAEGRPTAGVMDLPEGWYALPMPTEVQE